MSRPAVQGKLQHKLGRLRWEWVFADTQKHLKGILEVLLDGVMRESGRRGYGWSEHFDFGERSEVLGVESVDSGDVVFQHSGYEVEVKDTVPCNWIRAKKVAHVIKDARPWIDHFDC